LSFFVIELDGGPDFRQVRRPLNTVEAGSRSAAPRINADRNETWP